MTDVVYVDGWKIWRDDQMRTYACRCVNPQKRNQELEKRAQLPRVDAQICSLAQRYAQKFDRKRCWLMFQGEPRSGKTAQAVLIARAVINLGFKARYIHLPSFVRDLVALRSKPELRKEHLDALRVSLVVVDDLLRNLPTVNAFEYPAVKDAINDVFFTLANNRIPAVITTSASWSQIGMFDQSLASQIYDHSKGYVARFNNDWELERL